MMRHIEDFSEQGGNDRADQPASFQLVDSLPDRADARSGAADVRE
ncbi:hypothetical protein [Methylorubrum extorquens]